MLALPISGEGLARPQVGSQKFYVLRRTCSILAASCTQLRRAHAMKSTITCAIVAILTLPISLSASLGREASSVQEDVAKMQGALRTSSGDSYPVHEIQTPTCLPDT